MLERAAYFVAAWDGDTLIGFGRVFADVYWAQILDVMTHPDYRRRGVAKGIVSRLITYADAAAQSDADRCGWARAFVPTVRFYGGRPRHRRADVPAATATRRGFRVSQGHLTRLITDATRQTP